MSASPTSGVHNAKYVAISVIWGTILLFNTVIALQALYRWEVNRETLRRQDAHYPGLVEIQRQTTEVLAGYAWVNEDAQIARIPIEDAITRLIAQRQAGEDRVR